MKSLSVDNSNRLKKIIGKLSTEDSQYICRVICSDPLTGTYWILLIIYVFILVSFLLWPFDFFFFIKNDVHWIENSNGIEIPDKGQVLSNSSHQELFGRLVKSNGLTIEVWLETGDINQSGLARILSYSKNKDLSNFTIGQAWDKLVLRFRTTKTSLKGTSPHLVINDTFNYRSLIHLVVMHDLSEQRVYINGEQRARSNVLKGDYSNWDSSCRLVIGNEVTGDRPWKGRIYYIAVFDRPLTEQEINKNYLLGFQPKKSLGSSKITAIKSKGPVTRYLFDEGKEDMIHDSGSALSPVNLFIPKYIKSHINPFLGVSISYFWSKSSFSDIILNILIFIPYGILLHGMLRTRYELSMKISLATLLAGTLFSFGVESLQHFSITRNSSFIDVFTNMTGMAIGIVIDRFYNLFLSYQGERLQMLLYDRTE